MNIVLPLVREQGLSSFSSFEDASDAQLDEIRDLVAIHGALLLRGHAIDTPERFAQMVSRIDPGMLPYLDGTSPRTKVQGNVYTSTEYPADSFIPLHNELSYSAAWPAKLFFCCVTPAQTQGHTLLGDSAAILEALDHEVRSLFKKKGVMYVRNLPAGAGIGLSWTAAFETTDRSIVEAYCVRSGIEFEWKADDTLRLITRRPATAFHPRTGKEVWFNQANLFHPSANHTDVYALLMELYGDEPFELPQYACFGDGTAIPEAMLSHIREIAEKHTFRFDWRQGDFLVIDNMLVSHGRSPYTGDRKILVAMTA